MGAWSVDILGDDTALEVFGELLDASDPRQRMAQAFAEAVKSETVDFDAGHRVLVSAAIMAHASGALELKSLSDMDTGEDDVDSWIDGLRQLDFSSLNADAARACKKVLHGESELRELWEENDELFPQWVAQGEALVRVLSPVRSD